MGAILADTHAIIWYLFEPAQLSPAADAAFTATVRSGHVIYVSAISLIEIRYLIEKDRLPPVVWSDLLAVLLDPSVPVELLPVDLSVAQSVEQVARSAVPDLPDRIIASTAVARAIPLVTADRMIRTSSVQTIW